MCMLIAFSVEPKRIPSQTDNFPRTKKKNVLNIGTLADVVAVGDA